MFLHNRVPKLRITLKPNNLSASVGHHIGMCDWIIDNHRDVGLTRDQGFTVPMLRRIRIATEPFAVDHIWVKWRCSWWSAAKRGGAEVQAGAGRGILSVVAL